MTIWRSLWTARQLENGRSPVMMKGELCLTINTVTARSWPVMCNTGSRILTGCLFGPRSGACTAGLSRTGCNHLTLATHTLRHYLREAAPTHCYHCQWKYFQSTRDEVPTWCFLVMSSLTMALQYRICSVSLLFLLLELCWVCDRELHAFSHCQARVGELYNMSMWEDFTCQCGRDFTCQRGRTLQHVSVAEHYMSV